METNLEKQQNTQKKISLKICLQNFPSLRSIAEPKLREKENILEAYIEEKVEATIFRMKEIVHQKLILIRALKNGQNLSDENV